MTTQDSLRLQCAESLVASLTADLATERERVRVAREKWDALFLCISGDQGYFYDATYAECVTCRSSAATIAEIINGEDCFTDLCGEMSRALAQPSAPTVAKSATVQIGAPVQAEQKEWRVTFTILAGHPGVRQSIDTNNRPLIFSTEKEADDCIAGKMECSPQLYREPQDIRKLERTKAGEWQDAEAKEKADAGQ